MNKIFLSGRLTRDVDKRYTQKGTAWARTGIAVDRRSKDAGADFFNVVAWDKTAEFLSNWFSKGSKLLLEGHLQFNQYTDKDGNKKSTVDVIVDSVEFADSKKKSDSGNPGNDIPTPLDDEGDYPF